jgi:hypothetical protein
MIACDYRLVLLSQLLSVAAPALCSPGARDGSSPSENGKDEQCSCWLLSVAAPALSSPGGRDGSSPSENGKDEQCSC